MGSRGLGPLQTDSRWKIIEICLTGSSDRKSRNFLKLLQHGALYYIGNIGKYKTNSYKMSIFGYFHYENQLKPIKTGLGKRKQKSKWKSLFFWKMQDIKQKYNTLDDPFHFASPSRIRDEVKNIDNESLMRWLQSVSSYNMFKPRKKRFLRRNSTAQIWWFLRTKR